MQPPFEKYTNVSLVCRKIPYFLLGQKLQSTIVSPTPSLVSNWLGFLQFSRNIKLTHLNKSSRGLFKRSVVRQSLDNRSCLRNDTIKSIRSLSELKHTLGKHGHKWLTEKFPIWSRTGRCYPTVFHVTVKSFYLILLYVEWKMLKMQCRKAPEHLFFIALVLEINQNSRGLIHCLEFSPNYTGRGLR